MRTKTLFATAAVLFATSIPSLAHAEGGRVASLRETLRDLDARARAVRSQAERASPQVRSESHRIVGAVDAERTFLDTKLELYAMQGKNELDDATVAVIENRRAAAERLLALVEGWYRTR